MELNYILIWLVGASTVVHTLTLRGRVGRGAPGWYVVSGIIAAVLGVGLLAAPQWAGFAAGLVWLALVGLPLLGARLLGRLLARARYAAATPVAWFVSFLHPADGWPAIRTRVRVLGLLRAGAFQDARQRLTQLSTSEDAPQAVWAQMLSFRLDQDWAGLRSWVERHDSPGELLADPHARHGYLRALGELSEVEALLAAYLAARSVAGQRGPDRAMDQLVTAAFCGRVDLVERLYATPLAERDRAERKLWTATALQTSGDPAGARLSLEQLADGCPPDIGRAVSERLETPLPVVSLNTGLPRKALSILERDVATWDVRAAVLGRKPVATWSLLIVLFAVFMLELPGGSTNPENLYALGMLVLPAELGDGGWWRFLTAGFLHFGPLHYALNSAALFLFGRVLERVYGPWRLLLLYMVANVGALLAVAAFTQATAASPHMIVGASGGVMGLVGAMTALVGRAWLRFGTRALSAQLTALLVILALQITFDAVTPMVSQTAHLAGLFAGLLLGLGLLPERSPLGGAAERRR